MKIERLREEMEVFNKMDGNMYKVVSVSNDNEISGIAHLMLDEGVNPDVKVEITEKNALVFRVERDPKPYELPTGYEVKEGILVKDGAAVCDQGNIVIKEILAELPRKLVLTAEAEPKKEGYVSLYLYDVQKDWFTNVLKSVPNPTYIGYLNKKCDKAAFAFSVEEWVEVTEEDTDKKVEKRKFVSSGLFTVNSRGHLLMTTLKMPINTGRIQLAYNPEEEEYKLFVPVSEKLDENKFIQKKEITTWYCQMHDYWELTDPFDMENPEITWSPMYHAFVVKNDEKIIILDENESLKITGNAISKLPSGVILIDITKDRAKEEYRLAFCDQSYNITTVISKKTKDRGYLVSVL